MSYGVSSRLLDEQPAEMSMEPNNASNTIAIMTDRNQIGIDLKSTAKTIRISAMVEALTTQRMRMRMMRLVNNNLTTLSAGYKNHWLSLTLDAFARSNGPTKFSDLPNWLISVKRVRNQYAT
jgi:hypothetical protein